MFEVDTVNAEDDLYAEELRLLIELNINKMPEQRRRIFQMSRNENMTNDEIAECLGITKKTVENQLSLALKELKKVISVSLFLLCFLHI